MGTDATVNLVSKKNYISLALIYRKFERLFKNLPDHSHALHALEAAVMEESKRDREEYSESISLLQERIDTCLAHLEKLEATCSQKPAT